MFSVNDYPFTKTDESFVPQVYIFNEKVVDASAYVERHKKPFMLHFHAQNDECNERCRMVK